MGDTQPDSLISEEPNRRHSFMTVFPPERTVAIGHNQDDILPFRMMLNCRDFLRVNGLESPASLTMSLPLPNERPVGYFRFDSVPENSPAGGSSPNTSS